MEIITLRNSRNSRRLSATLSNLPYLELDQMFSRVSFQPYSSHELCKTTRLPSSYHRLLSRAAFLCPLVLRVVFLYRAQERVDAQTKVQYRFS